MTSFQGYEVVPAEGMVRHGRTTVRITVSAKKVCLSRPLIKALKNPSHIVFYHGVGENEGKIIITAAREDDDTEKILITPDRKSVYFWKSDFVSMCVKMVQKYAGGAFKRGTFYSVAGLPFDDEPGQTAKIQDGFTPPMNFSMPNLGAARGGMAF